MKNNSFVELPATVVYNAAIDLLCSIEKKRDMLWKKAVENEMQRKRFVFFGRTFTEEEATTRLQNDDKLVSTWDNIFRLKFGFQEDRVTTISNSAALMIRQDATSTVMLSLEDANLIAPYTKFN